MKFDSFESDQCSGVNFVAFKNSQRERMRDKKRIITVYVFIWRGLLSAKASTQHH